MMGSGRERPEPASEGAPLALFIGGAHKAGTTALFRRLCQHPELAGHAQSELTFFVEDEEYAHGFSSRAWRRYWPADLGARRFVGKHVKLMYRREALERLRAHAPDVHLVLLLRHPVERAYSAYWHARSLGRERLSSFEQALASETDRLRAGLARWHDTAYVHNGLYAEHLEQVFALLRRPQIHIFLLEELRERALELCRSLFVALGVDPGFSPAPPGRENRATRARSEPLARGLSAFFECRAPWRRALRAAVPDRIAVRLRELAVELNSRPLAVPPMDPRTRAELLERFREPNARLARLIGRDLSAWNG